MPVRLFSRDELLLILRPFGVSLVFRHDPGFEVWETGWSAAFTLRPEPGPRYSEGQVRRALDFCVNGLPENWTLKTR